MRQKRICRKSLRAKQRRLSCNGKPQPTHSSEIPCNTGRTSLIDRRMVQADTINMAAYLRKMAIDGYVVKLDLPELRDMISLLRRTSNNFNQIARRVNSTNRVYENDIQEMKTMLEQLWEANNSVLEKLAAID